MKKSFMNNLKNFVDSNVRLRIDRVTNSSCNSNNDLFNDDLLLVERHFEDLRLFCIEAEKKISNILQSIQISSTTPSPLGAYTQNMQAGINNLSHNIAQQAANITSHVGASNNLATNDNAKSSDSCLKNSSTFEQEPKSSTSYLGAFKTQHQSNESLSVLDNTVPCFSKDRSSGVNQVSNTTNSHASTELKNDTLIKFKKLPVVGFYKFLTKTSNKLKQDSLLALTLTQYSQMQTHLTNLYLMYEQMIDTQCLKPIQQMLEADIPNVLKLKKTFMKAYHDFELSRVKYNGASQKHNQQIQSGISSGSSYLITQNSTQQNSMSKLEQLKNELDEFVTRCHQAKDAYEAELYAFVCREPELVNLIGLFYQLQSEYNHQASVTILNSLPAINKTLERTPRKFAFGTQLDEHLRCTGRKISPVLEIAIHLLHSQGLREEGLFRIPGSSVKIKKLKNGINAQFLTLLSLSELESDQRRQSSQSCIVAIYELFKNSVGQRPLRPVQHDSSCVILKSSFAVDEASLSQAYCPPDHDHNAHQYDYSGSEYLLDVHSIAGLLKLYLRELPEPLLTYALYDEWVNCVSNTDSTSTRLESLSKVIKKLPNSHYENLKHLIKFLNELTHYHEHNKMTSVNLAIAMSPSLLWSKSTKQEQVSTQNTDLGMSSGSVPSLNMQISSFGMSASQHAMILEALINHSDTLFPEPTDFTLSEFANLTLKSDDIPRNTSKREVKSTSPTGLSTTSSSSFSSVASNSTASSAVNKGHNRKGGSMEGLLDDGSRVGKTVLQQNMSTRSFGRPVSVQLRREEYSTISDRTNLAQDFKVQVQRPPVPLARANLKQMNNNRILSKSSKKSQAPPVPPPTSVRHQLERLKMSSNLQMVHPGENQINENPRPMSLRGTGTIGNATLCSTSLGQITTRPSVPPPDRPPAVIGDNIRDDDKNCKSLDNNDVKNVPDNFTYKDRNILNIGERTTYKNLTEHVCSKQDSPNDSLEAITDNDDSSFDDDNDITSLDRSWTKCFSPSVNQEGNASLQRTEPCILADDTSSAISGHMSTRLIENGRNLKSDKSDRDANETKPPARPLPPVKPPRSTSPKITQSTPL